MARAVQIADDLGESFDKDELTNDEAKAALELQEQEASRAAKAKRSTGRQNVSSQKAAGRAHATPSSLAKRAQAPARENPAVWTPAATLEAPPARSGMVQRWIRVHKPGGSDDPVHLNRKLREGWQPVQLDEAADYSPPTIQHARLGNVIGVGDLILCEMPIQLFRSRKAHFDKIRARQTAAAERKPLAEFEKDGEESPFIETRKTQSIFAKRKRKVSADE
jgi:hypothetical protein